MRETLRKGSFSWKSDCYLFSSYSKDIVWDFLKHYERRFKRLQQQKIIAFWIPFSWRNHHNDFRWNERRWPFSVDFILLKVANGFKMVVNIIWPTQKKVTWGHVIFISSGFWVVHLIHIWTIKGSLVKRCMCKEWSVQFTKHLRKFMNF